MKKINIGSNIVFADGYGGDYGGSSGIFIGDVYPILDITGIKIPGAACLGIPEGQCLE